MNRKAVKAISGVLCASMLMGNVTSVFAATTDTQTTSNETDSKSVEVTYDKSASYFVTIPKVITLDSNKTSKYSVKVEGDVPSDKNVYVAPEDAISQTDEIDFYMYDQSTKNTKADVVATVIHNKDTWDFEDVANGVEETNNKISASQLTAGNWKGTFNFNINMKGAHKHTYTSEVTKEPTCTEAGVKTFTCENGDDSYTEEIPALGHSFSSEYTIDKNATCTEAGSKSQHCSRCSAKQNVTSIPATGHKYGTPTYTWSADGKTCTAKRVCANNASHIETENATITNKVKVNANCTTKGTTTYTATFKNSAFTTQTKDVQDINALGHKYASTYTIDKNATCTEAGSKSQHCSRCNAKQNVTSIPATGHKYVNDRCTLCGKSLYGEDVTLTSDNLATYGIAKEGGVTIPSVVTDTKGIKHKVTSIGNNAFRGCRGLYEITIPESVTSIGSDAFYNTKLSGVTYKGQFYFRLSELTNALISNGVSVGGGAFLNTHMA